MSKTNIKNAAKVWQGFLRLSLVINGGGVNFASTGAIVKETGLSRPTVAKYMHMALGEGAVRKERLSGGLVLWVREEGEDYAA